MLLCAVQGATASYDVSLEISVSIVGNDVFRPDDSFHAKVEIRNREAHGRIDVVVTYNILDMDEHIVMSDSKTVAVETKSSFAEEFTLPDSIQEGTYLIRVNVSTLDKSKWTEASRSFHIVVVTEDEQRFVEYIMAFALILTGGALIYEHKRISKLKVSGRDLKKFIDEQYKK